MSIFSGVKAQGTWTIAAGHLADAETLQIGNITYRFKTTTAQAYDIYLPAGGNDAADVAALASLVKAINGTGTVAASGAYCYTGTLKHKYVKAAQGSTTRIMVVTCLLPGTIGNLITFVDGCTNASVDAATLGTTTAGTGSAAVDLQTWIAYMRAHVQCNSEVLRYLSDLEGELA